MYIGQLYFTRGVQELINNKQIANADVWESIDRHMRFDHGDLCPEDVKVNQMNLNHNSGTVMSIYVLNGIRIWVHTCLGSVDTTYTTVLLPEEY